MGGNFTILMVALTTQGSPAGYYRVKGFDPTKYVILRASRGKVPCECGSRRGSEREKRMEYKT